MLKKIDVVAAFIFKDGKMLIGRRKPNIANEGKWEFPGGKIKLDETLEEAIVREIDEEFGMEIQANEVLGYIQTKIEENFEIKLIGIHCLTKGDIIHMKDHDLITWCEIDELQKVNLSKADVLLLSKYKQKMKEMSNIIPPLRDMKN